MDMSKTTFVQAVCILVMVCAAWGSWPALTLVYRAITDPILDTLFGPRVEEIECSCTPMYAESFESDWLPDYETPGPIVAEMPVVSLGRRELN